MQTHTEYRIRSKAEFLKELGPTWREECDWNQNGLMDHLFGQPLSKQQNLELNRYGICTIPDPT